LLANAGEGDGSDESKDVSRLDGSPLAGARGGGGIGRKPPRAARLIAPPHAGAGGSGSSGSGSPSHLSPDFKARTVHS
jgi:hypothetical protein